MANEQAKQWYQSDEDRRLVLHLGHEELIIRRRYHLLSVVNDFLIGIWFLIGSAAFLDERWQLFGTWLFIVGSAQLLIRPLIRLAHGLHLKHIPSSNWDM